jgi:hypothetical protein
MKRTVVLAAVALLPLTLASSAKAGSKGPFVGLRSFVGLWEG